jgi:hypothetical protein
MNNRLLLSIALLFSMPVFGRVAFESAQQRLSHVEGRLHQVDRELKELDSKAQGTHKALQAISGKPEYGQDLERRSALVRSRIDRYNQLVAQRQQILNERQQVIGEIGHKFAVSFDENAGRYNIARPQETSKKNVASAE